MSTETIVVREDNGAYVANMDCFHPDRLEPVVYEGLGDSISEALFDLAESLKDDSL